MGCDSSLCSNPLIVQRRPPIYFQGLVAIKQNEGNHQTEETLSFRKGEAKNSILKQLGCRER